MTTAPVKREPWHLDRRIPIATIFVLLVQFAVGIMWITTIANDVKQHDSDITDLRVDAQNRENRIRTLEITLAGQTSDLRAIQVGISRIEAQLEKLQEKRHELEPTDR